MVKLVLIREIRVNPLRLRLGRAVGVVEVHPDGSVTVVEQNVFPNPGKVTRNVIPRLDAGEETKKTKKGNDEITTTMKVAGDVKAYRPIPKPPKGASLGPSPSHALPPLQHDLFAFDIYYH